MNICREVSELYWSPVCLTDKQSYLAYLYLCYTHGSGTGIVGSVGGTGSYTGCDGRCVDNGSGVIRAVFGNVSEATSSRLGDVAGVVGDGSVEGFVDCSVSGSAFEGEATVGGVSGVDVDRCECGLHCGHRDGVGECRWQSQCDPQVDGGSVGSQSGYKNAKVLGPNGGVSKGRGPNYEKNQLRRIGKREKKRGIKLGAGCSPLEVVSDKGVSSEKELSTSDKLKKSFDERRIAENELATQRARYNIRRNEYLQKSRVSEQKWETERLTSDEKLRKISEARLGASPGFAKTIIEEGLASSSAPSLSDGTVSPNSSISVEEVQKMNRTIEKLTGEVAELKMVNQKFSSFIGSRDSGVGSSEDEEDEEDPRDKGKPYVVLRGECVPRVGEYRFKTDQFRNGNKVMAIDGKIVELNWKGKPARYIGGVEDMTMPSEKDPYENLVNYDGYIPPMF